MRAYLSELWHLGPGNPLAVRVVATGGRLASHLWIRIGYLGVLAGLTVIMLIANAGFGTLAAQELAKTSDNLLKWIAYCQVVLICLVTPLFMAGAIASEQAGKTWNILLTTPLTGLQIVLGILFGRLFLITALLLSGLPLFAVLLIFGGATVSAVAAAFSVAFLTALFVGAVAVALAVFRVGGRKMVFAFVVLTVTFLLAVYGLDRVLLRTGTYTTWATPFHPLLVLESYLNADNYGPHKAADLVGHGWWARLLLGRPLTAFALFSGGGAALLLALSAVAVRLLILIEDWLPVIKRRLGLTPRMKPRPMTGTGNPVAWREAAGHSRRVGSVLFRAMFILSGMAAAAGLLLYLHRSNDPKILLEKFQDGLMVLLFAQVAVGALVAVYLASGAVSREREDGTLDILLTTPITPRSYIWGKLAGLVRFLAWLAAAPVATLALVALYSIVGGLLNWKAARISMGNGADDLPLVLPESPLLLAAAVLPFLGLCVAVGLHWSIRTRTILGALVPTLITIGLLLLVVGGISHALHGAPFLGPLFALTTPVSAVPTCADPAHLDWMADAGAACRVVLVFGAVGAAGLALVVVVAVCSGIVRGFDHIVRRLSGTGN